MFSEQSIVVREICNGIMTVSAIFLIVVLTVYVWRWSRRMVYRTWYSDFAIQGAFAVAIMMTGHAIRAGGGWIQFLYLDLGWDTDIFANSIEYFIIATVFIVLGKMLIVFFFSDEKWRLRLTVTALVASVSIPLAVAAFAKLATW